MRAIDADAFKDYIRGACEEMKHLYKDNGAWAKEITESFCKDIDEQPTIQPEIVRCKDCKHHWTHKCMDSMPIERCDLEQTFYDAEHDFCSLAERREVTT